MWLLAVLILSFQHGLVALVADPHAVIIDPPAEIKLVDFNKCSSTFEVELVGEEGAGPFYVSGDELAESVASLSKGIILDMPDTVINRKYNITKKIAFHPPPFLEKRKAELCK